MLFFKYLSFSPFIRKIVCSKAPTSFVLRFFLCPHENTVFHSHFLLFLFSSFHFMSDDSHLSISRGFANYYNYVYLFFVCQFGLLYDFVFMTWYSLVWHVNGFRFLFWWCNAIINPHVSWLCLIFLSLLLSPACKLWLSCPPTLPFNKPLLFPPKS